MRVLVLGATGNIGNQVIDVINELKYKLVGISFYKNIQGANKIKCQYKYSPINTLYSNARNYKELIEKSKPNIVVNAIIGFAGLSATIEVLQHRQITLCLANKESLVVAGQFIMKMAKQNKINILPIDSEHASVFQILRKNKNAKFQKIYITASGGPFYKHNKDELTNIEYNQAIKHPTWKMGEKISIDSATLINKCFEIVEAYWYFHTKQIEALYHPHSLVHAIVKYKNTMDAFVNAPDMHLPIKQALTNFHSKFNSYIQKFDKSQYEIKNIDENKWLPIKWAYQIIQKPNYSLPIIINGANEEAILLFKQNKIRFLDIIPTIQAAIKHLKNRRVLGIENVYQIDTKVRTFIKNMHKI